MIDLLYYMEVSQNIYAILVEFRTVQFLCHARLYALGQGKCTAKITARFIQLKRWWKKQWPHCWEDSRSKEPYLTCYLLQRQKDWYTQCGAICKHSLYVQCSNLPIWKVVHQTCRNNLSFLYWLGNGIIVYMYLLLCLRKSSKTKLICACWFIKEFHK